ncbi:phosphatidylinositol 3,4,5-trisphosphate 5-phosphatase 1-like [Leptonychotes weddellii]|uniref:Phosphatidylinositol 3,4,5-trisphosphate 5-phosphatase 1-like n=1 Tax=Leptonychotes weddellii TaxID=9713 RepID=A0A7F8RB80_LEPWE|nr:phosphatidylinositol 3,4,5-trisphosphate 5-phosphatase 1-like [Leptonychotes weddellii]
MVAKLSQLTSLLSSIEDKVKALLHEGAESPHRRSLIPPVTFEVKSESLGIPQKLQLKVDVESGKLIIKKSKDGSEDKFYTHNKILQLIKSQKFLNKLVILVETEREKTLRKEYVFADSKVSEGCIALRLEATETQLPIYTPLTHHGEMTGHFRGEIKLQTSQGKMREKLYENPLGIKQPFVKCASLCLLSATLRPCDLGKNSAEPSPQEDAQLTKPEMFENPLYGSVSSFPKLLPRKEQESPKMLRKEPLPCPDPGILSPSILLPKAQEAEGTKGTGKPAPTPFLSPTPRLRSFTCSSSAEGRPAGGDKSQGKAKGAASLQAQVPAKRPVKPSRSELSQQAPPPPPAAQRPPLPVKSPAVLHLQHSKGRDYRENAELPHHGKHRPEDAPLSRAAMQ